jgi:hypothetical protein
VLFEIRSGNDCEQITGKKRGDRSHTGALPTRDKISDESNGDDDRPRCNHRYRNRVKELLLIQPMVLLDNTTIKERNDRQTAAEYECACLREEIENLPEYLALWCGSCGRHEKRNE